MTTAEFGDPNLGQAHAPAPDVPLAPPTLTPPAPVEPLVQPAVAAPVAAPAAPVPVSDMRDVPLGTLIFREGLLTEEQLEEALQDGIHRGKRLGEVLLERGLVSENDLGRLLAGQKGLQFVQLDAAAIDPSAVHLLPVEKARLHSILPIGFRDGLPVVAVADPTNDLVLENVRRSLNCNPHLVVAGREALQRQIEAAYSALPVAPSEPVPAVPTDAPVVAAEPAPPVAPVAPAPPAPVAAPLEHQPAALEPLQPLVAAPAEPAPLVQPEPVFQPVPVEPVPVLQPEPVVLPDPAPVVASEPVQPLAETPPVAAPAPEPLAVSATPLETPVPPVEPVAHEEEPEPAQTWYVVLRLADGERLDIGAFDSAGDAREHAKNVVEQISTDSGWPFFHGRFLRPEAIVSVDLVEPEGRWLGSAARRAWASQD